MNKFKRYRSKRGIIPYDIRLTERARTGRKNLTECENIIWKEILQNRRCMGYRFVRQKPIDEFILDFYCSKLLLGVEIDGKYHNDNVQYDLQRTYIIDSYGIKIIRFKNEDIIFDLQKIKDEIVMNLKQREKEITLDPFSLLREKG